MARLKHLTLNLSDKKLFDDAFNRLKDLKPREAAIVGAQLLDTCLERQFRIAFKHLSKSDFDQLFSGDAPLSTFSAKIKIAYALGLAPREVRNDLMKIREIRNAFAHSLMEFDFEEEKIKQICISFEYLEKIIKSKIGDLQIDNLFELMFPGMNQSNMQHRFAMCCMLLKSLLWMITIKISKHGVISDELFPPSLDDILASQGKLAK